MRRTRTVYVLLFSIVATTLLTFLLSGATIAQIRVTDGPPLIPPESPRLIVELESPPLAVAYKSMIQAEAADGTLDVNSAAAQAYVEQIQAEQALFVNSLQESMPSAAVSTFVNELGASEQATYQIVLNAIAIDPGMDREQARRQLQRLPGVKAVYLDRPYQTMLYTSTHLINAPDVWNSAAIGGVGNAGARIRVASVDGGIHKDAPMFSGEGYTYPPGYEPNGLGLTANNNGKIIVSRAYFRPWDPPAPGDENPWPGVNGTSHGVHTASIAAGNCVEDATIAGLNVGTLCGIAPQAYVMSYRIFYESVNGNGSSYTTEMLAALEDVVADGAQVVNNSWGAGPISEGNQFDPVNVALINAVNAGVFVSMATGNSGPGLGTSDHTSSDYINVAASTTSGALAAGRLGISAPPPVDDDNKDFPFIPADFGGPIPLGQVNEYPFVPAGAVDPGNALGCDSFDPGAFAGKAAVIQRGDCAFVDKFFNAQEAGALFVIIFNNDGDDLVTMICDINCDAITVSGVFIGETDGQKLLDWYNVHGDASEVEFNSTAFQVGNTPDLVIGFSSRGPGVGNTLKPDIAAPGVNILAQGYAPGQTGEARHLGFGQASGTSMASPHVAGAAALLRQLHPDWSPADIKSALMSSSKYLEIYTTGGKPAQPLDMGAGRLDVAAAVNPGVLLDPPNLSFSIVPTGTEKTIVVQVRSVATETETYSLTTLYTGDSFTQTTTLPGFSVSPATLDLAPGETKPISVTFTAADGRGYGDNQGFVLLTGDQHNAHMPAWARVAYTQPLADILIIDNDFSEELGLSDYLAYYTNALDQLGLTYTVVDTGDGVAQEATIPDATTLAAYRAILFFTGDNNLPDGTFTVFTGLTQLDQDRLVEYLNGGGALIAMGQNLAAALGADEFDTEIGFRNFLYAYRLGANWVQNSVTAGQQPAALIVPSTEAPPIFHDLVVDLTQPNRYGAAGDLTGDQVVPPAMTETTGDFLILYDGAFNQLRFSVRVEPTQTVTITVSEIELRAGAVGDPGTLVRNLDLNGVLPAVVTNTLTVQGVITDLTPTEIDLLLTGGMHINVATLANSDGEVRGQVEFDPLAQLSIDEIDTEFHDGSQEPDPQGDTPESTTISKAILRYPGPFNEFDGTVAIANRDQPSLERPGTIYSGQSIYTTFGLEGVSHELNASHDITPTTRSELLGLFLDWLWAEPGTAVITPTAEVTTSATVIFSATLESLAPEAIQPLQAVRYRWDFGDGTPFVTSASEVAGHTYLCAEDNTHTVRVAIEDQYGNVAIGSLEFDASQACFTEAPTLQEDLFLPRIHRNIVPE